MQIESKGEIVHLLEREDFQAHLEQQVLPEYLPTRRWFGAKNVVVKKYSISSVLKCPTENFPSAFLEIEIRLATANTEKYLLPAMLCPESDKGEAEVITEYEVEGERYILADALENADFRNLLFEYMLGDRQLKINEGWLDFERGSNLKKPQKIESRLLDAEQSNTTVVYQDKYFLKIYRKLFRDLNPDYELASFLSERTSYANSPAYAGSITWKRKNFYMVTLGLMQEKIEHQGEAWGYFLGRVKQYFANLDRHKVGLQELPKVDLYKPLALGDVPLRYIELIGLDTLQKIQRLAQRTAEMHVALFSDKTDRVFAPVNFGSDYRVWLLNRLIYQFENRFNLLELNYHKLSEQSQQFADYVLQNREEINNKILSFDDEYLNSARIRIHGDYHLGQVLLSDDDFYILDFEGEPESTIRDRKVKQPPIKDVAGMLRSFHYAIFATIFGLQESRMSQEELMEAGGRFYRVIGGMFMHSYTETAFANDLDIGYAREIDFLLRYHLFEKAIYELGYELNSRPDWVIIPLKGIIQILKND